MLRTLLAHCLFVFLFIGPSLSSMLAQRGVPTPVFASTSQDFPSISGTVIGDDGQPLRAVVTALKIGTPVRTGRADSDINGSFSIRGLIEGTYQLCVAEKNGDYLDPCTWSAVAPRATIVGQIPVVNYRLTAMKGARLQVRLNDADQLLSAGNQTDAHLIVAVITERHTLQSFGVASQDSAGRTLQTTVPTDRPVLLNIFGKGATVIDSSGKTLDVTHGTRLSVPTAAEPTSTPVTLTITRSAR